MWGRGPRIWEAEFALDPGGNKEPLRFLSLLYDEQSGLQTGLRGEKLKVGTMALRLLQSFKHR